MYAPVRGALVALDAGDGIRAEITASWLGQMGWKTAVIDTTTASARESTGPWVPAKGVGPEVPASDRYRRPYVGTDVPAAVMEAYLEWEYGLVEQLERDGTHNFFVL